MYLSPKRIAKNRKKTIKTAITTVVLASIVIISMLHFLNKVNDQAAIINDQEITIDNLKHDLHYCEEFASQVNR